MKIEEFKLPELNFCVFRSSRLKEYLKEYSFLLCPCTMHYADFRNLDDFIAKSIHNIIYINIRYSVRWYFNFNNILWYGVF